jgi:hypothetical protein
MPTIYPPIIILGFDTSTLGIVNAIKVLNPKAAIMTAFVTTSNTIITMKTDIGASVH